jgi:tRNA uridine 5-carboxymethylaminomethyl modification enzyme
VQESCDVIVIGGGHAGVEAAWAAANILGETARVVLVTQDPTKIGVMSCNPAIGGLAKGQMVREIDALGGVMGLATDQSGIQFKVLNTSKGAAVHGPRAQCDKHAYAECVQRLIASRRQITIVAGTVERLIVEGDGAGRAIAGVVIRGVGEVKAYGWPVDAGGPARVDWAARAVWRDGEARLASRAVVLTTGTFMRGLMHTGESKAEGGRFGEGAAVGISGALRELGFELGRLKTGTPPRLRRGTIAWDELEPQVGDDPPVAFSELSIGGVSAGGVGAFPVLRQVECRITSTSERLHELIRANLHRAPMFSGQIEGVGPRYCPSLEDKVVRFADKASHHVYLEPESLRDDWVYANGISTSLPADVQGQIVRGLPGCAGAEILRFGYAVEYDMIRPHQLRASGESKPVAGLFLAGQINGTSGYEEAAGQGLIAGVNAARRARGEEGVTLGRDEAYIGVLMDDLATKTPVEPYRMFTSRAEHRLLLRSDNAPDRLTPLAERWGLLAGHEFGERRRGMFAARREAMTRLAARIGATRVQGISLVEMLRRPEVTTADLAGWLGEDDAIDHPGEGRLLATVHADHFYEPYARKARSAIARQRDLDRQRIPADFDYQTIASIRNESRQALLRYRPETLGQASRLEGLTPADVTLLAVLIRKHRAGAVGGGAGGGGGSGVDGPSGR